MNQAQWNMNIIKNFISLQMFSLTFFDECLQTEFFLRKEFYISVLCSNYSFSGDL